MCHRASAAPDFSCILCRMGFNRLTGLWAAACIAVAAALATTHAQQAPPASQPPPPATAFLAGQVVEYPSGKPIAGATVLLIGRGDPRGVRAPVITDGQGRFYFANLLPGTYQTQVGKTGYSYPSMTFLVRPVQLAVGERVTDVKVTLVKFGAISGTLRDDAGDPVVGMQVVAMRRGVVNGRVTMVPGGTAKSDDRGVYRVGSLLLGDYIVCACASDPMPLDGVLLTTLASQPLQLMGATARALKVGSDAVSFDDSLKTFAPTMFPMSNTVARAVRVAVKSGDETANIDVVLNATKSVRVSGRISGGPGGMTANGIRLVAVGESDEGAALTQMTPMLVQPDGRFDFINVPSGSYMLMVNQVTGAGPFSAPTYSGIATAFLGGRSAAATPPTAPGQPVRVGELSIFWASIPVTVGPRDVGDLQVTLRPGNVLSGKLQLDNGAPVPPTVVRGSVAIRPLMTPGGFAVPTFGAQAAADGSVRLNFGLPGRHAFDLQIAGLTVRRVELAGVDVTDLPLDLQTDASDLLVTVSTAPLASIEGTVTRAGALQDVTALIFTADRRLWAEPRAANRRFQAAAVSLKGAFTLSNLPGGDYFLAVLPDTETADWIEASRLEALSRTAQKVTLTDGEKKAIEVKR